MSKRKGGEGNLAATSQKEAEALTIVPAQKLARLAYEAQQQEGKRALNLVEVDGKSCTHEVAWPEGVEGSLLPPPQRPGPPAKEYPFKIDPFQQVSVNALETGHNVLVAAHTSAGKTVVAQYAFAMALRDGARVIYTSPLKALSNQKYRELAEEFRDVGLMTGDVTINPNASCLVMTTEILRSMLYRGSEVIRQARLVVYDEIHYLRDKERGVVWEESIILAPKSIRFAFLSATIPNSREFAEWVARIHGSPCHVVYTDYRPTPLQHYLFPQGGSGLYMVVDEKGTFREDNFAKAIAEMNDVQAGNAVAAGGKGGGKGSAMQGEGSDIHRVVKLIMERNYDPVIVFSFSKREVEALALQTAQMDLTGQDEKRLIDQIYWSALDILTEEDRKLPQVVNLLPMLRRGIGVHHSGLLPILKEVTEVLFQEGLLRALFATETFSTGLNMPAKTVVFTNARKFDGGKFRWVSSGEYIQMSGRAGRRGLDDKGVVILMADSKMEPAVAKGMLRGAPDVLYSEFHLKYSMILNLMRMEGGDPQEVMRRSYRQFQTERALPQIQRRISQLEDQVLTVQVPDEEQALQLRSALHQAVLCAFDHRQSAFPPSALVPFLQPGRLVRIVGDALLTAVQTGDLLAVAEEAGMIEAGADLTTPKAAKHCPPLDPEALLEAAEGHWGAVVNFERIGGTASEGSSASTSDRYALDVLVMCDPETVPKASSSQPKGSFRPRILKPGDDRGVPAVIGVTLEQCSALSSVRIFMPKDLRQGEQRLTACKAVAEVQRRFHSRQAPLPLLDPAKDLKADATKLEKAAKRLEAARKLLEENPLLKTQREVQAAKEAPPRKGMGKPELKNFAPLWSRLAALAQKQRLREQIDQAKREAKAAQSLILKDELIARQRVLKRLGYLDENEVVTLKGQVACSLATGDELVLAEMLFSGVFRDLSGDQLAALLSCFVWSEKSDRGGARVPEALEGPLGALRDCARRVGKVAVECRLPLDPEEYVDSFRPELMEAVSAWYRGTKFAEVLKLSFAFEGSLVRAIRRLEEVLRQLVAACQVLGDVGLAEKFEAAQKAIKRDIVFAASLFI